MEKDVVIGVCINIYTPGKTCSKSGQADLNGFPIGIDGHIDHIVSLSALGTAGIKDTQHLVGAADQVIVGIGSAGNDIRQTADSGAQRPGDDRMLFAESNDIFEKLEELLVQPQIVPVEPGDFIVLTIAVVVAVLCIAEFVSGKDHRRAAAAHQNSDGIAHHLVSELLYNGIVRGTLHAAVPAPVIVCAVRIVPAVCLIVLVVVGKQVTEERKP